MKLNLSKISKGHYRVQSDKIRVEVIKNHFSNNWQGSIESFEGMATDVFSREKSKVEMWELLEGTDVIYGDSKKEVVSALTSIIIKS